MNPVKATPPRWNSRPHPQRSVSPKTPRICAQWDAWDCTLDIYTLFVNVMQLTMILFFNKSYGMTWSWEIYTPHFLTNRIASWRNEIIYTSFLWSQYYLYHNHGQAREWREMTEILFKWNKYNFRNTDFLWKNSVIFFLLVYILHYPMGQIINIA